MDTFSVCERPQCKFALNYCDDCAKIFCKKCSADNIPSSLKIGLCKDCKPKKISGITSTEKCPECEHKFCIIDKKYCRNCEKLYCRICGPVWLQKSIPLEFKDDIICEGCRNCPLHNKEECEECITIRHKLSGLYDDHILKPSDINNRYEVKLVYEQTKYEDNNQINLYHEERITGVPHFITNTDINDYGKFNNDKYKWYYYIEKIGEDKRRLLSIKIYKL